MEQRDTHVKGTRCVGMKQSDAYDLLCKEYLSKCRESGCDGCVAEFYCIENHLRKDRYPQNDCHEKLKKYFQSK